MPAQEFKMMQPFKIIAFTCRKFETLRPLVVAEICDLLKSGEHGIILFVLYFQKISNYCL